MRVFYGKAVYDRKEIKASINVLKKKSLSLIDGPSVKELENKGVKTTINYKSIHTLKFYKNIFGYKDNDFKNSFIVGNEIISLPLYPSLSLKKVDYVSKVLINILNKLL